jgi:hypothetical protein
VSFFWETVTAAASYQLQVAASSAFTPPLILNKKVTTNQVNTSTLPTGTLFWRARARDSSGRPGAWSAPFQLTVTAG